MEVRNHGRRQGGREALNELAAELSEEAKELGKTTGKVALSAALATSLAAALQEPPNTDLMSLPEATPIVRVLEDEKPEVAPPEEDIEVDEAKERRQRLLKMLKYLLIALFLLGALLFGAMQGVHLLHGRARCSPTTTPSRSRRPRSSRTMPTAHLAATPIIGLEFVLSRETQTQRLPLPSGNRDHVVRKRALARAIVVAARV